MNSKYLFFEEERILKDSKVKVNKITLQIFQSKLKMLLMRLILMEKTQHPYNTDLHFLLSLKDYQVTKRDHQYQIL